MAYTCINHGVHEISGSNLATVMGNITELSGVFVVPVANGQQVLVLEVNET